MATEVMKTFSALQEELQKAKEGLRNVDSHLKRIIGRDPETQPPGQGPPRPGQKRPANLNEDFYGRGRGSFHFGGGRGRGAPQGRGQEEAGAPGIRRRLGERTGTVFSRLSGPPPKFGKKDEEGFSVPPPKFIKKEEEDEEMEDEDAQFKPAISSRVITQTRELPSKEDILAAQGDERSKARNRRMFGALLGTLQRFRQEETRMRDREDKRAQVEKKLEEAAKKEKEDMKKERIELFHDRRRKQQEIRRIELKILRLKEQDEWEARHRPLLNFIQTKAKPHVFYLPKIQNTKTEERLVASQKLIAKMIEKKRAAVQEELERLEGNVQNKTENQGEHNFEEEEEDMETDNGPLENSAESQHVSGDSPAENKENRLRSINVKVEKDSDQKGAVSGKIVRPEQEEKKMDGERRVDGRHPSNHHDRRDQRDLRDQRNHHERSRDRRREDQHEREKEHDHEKGKDRERGRMRERERIRARERRDDKEETVVVKKEEEEKWDRKRERHNSSDTNANEEDETREETKDPTAVELSSISLPGESSPTAQPSNDEEDENME